jgi:hypothetical protein
MKSFWRRVAHERIEFKLNELFNDILRAFYLTLIFYVFIFY